MTKKNLRLLITLFVLLFSTISVFALPQHAEAATKYWFQNNGDSTWSNPNNWYSDGGQSSPTSLPDASDDVIIGSGMSGPTADLDDPSWVEPVSISTEGQGLSVTSQNNVALSSSLIINCDVSFNGSSINNANITGNVSFHDSSKNTVSITGNADFYGTSLNDTLGNISGDVTFNDTSIDKGSIGGNVTFYNSSRAEAGAAVTGNATFATDYYGETIPINGTLTLNGTEIFALAVSGTIYDSNGQTINSWIFNDSSSNSVALSSGNFTYNNNSFNNSGVIGSYVTFNNSSHNNGTITSSVETSFRNSSYNNSSGEISGDTDFHESSSNNGSITGTTIFYNSSHNDNTVSGNAVFHDSTYNVGTVTGDATFSTDYYSSTLPSGGTFYFSNHNWGGSIGGSILGSDSQPITDYDFSNGTYSQSALNGNAIFHDTSTSQSGVTGNATYTGSAYNLNDIINHTPSGTLTFTDPVTLTVTSGWISDSSNWIFNSGAEWIFNDGVNNSGIVQGNVTFIGDSGENQGTISGTKTRRYVSSIITARNFVSDGPWTVIADDSVVDISGATFNQQTVFTPVNGGSFVGLSFNSYWYSTGSTDWTEISNWWQDSNHTVQASHIPDHLTGVIILGETPPIVNLDSWVIPASINSGSTGIVFDSNASTELTKDITGNAVFEGSAVNHTNISGDATFLGANSQNYGDIYGTSTFNGLTYTNFNSALLHGGIVFNNAVSFTQDNSDWAADTSLWVFNQGAVWLFQNGSNNIGTVVGTSTFAGGHNQGTINGNAIYNAATFTSWSEGTISGLITINGTSTFSLCHWSIDTSAWRMMGTSTWEFTGSGCSNNNFIQGNAVFYGDNTENTGTVSGIKTRYYSGQDLTPNRDFITDGPWTIVADGIAVNLNNSTTDSDTVLSAINGGFFGNRNVYYWYSTGNTDWSNPANWWFDAGHNQTAASLPTATSSVVIVGNLAPIINLGNLISPASINTGSSTLTVTSTSTLSYTIPTTGNVIFSGLAQDEATINGNISFTNADYTDFHFSTTTGTVTFTRNVTFTANTSDWIYDTSDWIFTGSADWIFLTGRNNLGTLTGTSRFYNSASDFGTTTATSTKEYTVFSRPTDNFIHEHYSTVIANSVIVDMSAALINDTVTLSAINNGRFVGMDHVDLAAHNFDNKITLLYSFDLNASSTPATSDFVVYLNGSQVAVQSVAISGRIITLTLATNITSNDVDLSYIPGVKPLRTSIDGVYEPGFSHRTVYGFYRVGKGSFNTIVSGQKVYVGNETTGSISVINTETNTVSLVATTSLISVLPIHPEFTARYGHKIYFGADNGIYAVDTNTDTYVARIAPISTSDRDGIIIVGSKMYVNIDEDDQVGVIDLDTDTIINHINVGDAPFYAASVGKKLYVTNRNSDSVSVIDTTSDTVITTLSVGHQPYYARAIGTKMYITNRGGGTVSVINTLSDTVSTITVGSQPVYMATYGSKLYVGNSDPAASSISVIDSNTNTVVATIQNMPQPYDLMNFDGKIIVANAPLFAFGQKTLNPITVIDPLTDTIVSELSLEYATYFLSGLNQTVYVTQNEGSPILTDNVSGHVSAVNLKVLPYNLPYLESFTTSAISGSYTVGQSISITANFNRDLTSTSTMTVLLNTGRTITLSTVSGRTLSGTYTISNGDKTPDLAISSITSANVSDTFGHRRTSYSISQTPGNLVAENSLLSRNIGDSKNIKIGSYLTIPVGTNPYQVSKPITVGSESYVYVANQGSDSVSVIRISDNTVVNTISVGSEPYGLSTAVIATTTYLYVANTGSDNVSVIDTTTNTVISTIPVGIKPYYVEHIGTKIYVTNSLTNSVSVIDANTNAVIDTVSVGSYPRGIKAHGTDLYVANYGDPNYGGGNSISVINSLTDTVTNTIILPGSSLGPRGVTVLGNKVYVTNYLSNNVSVIDTNTNTIINTIAVGAGPRGITPVGTNIYVENFDAGTISVIDSTNNTVTATINVGHSPAGMGVVGTDIYLSRFADNELSILNTNNNTLLPETTTNENTSTTTQKTTSSHGSSGGSRPSPVIVQTVSTSTPTTNPGPILTHYFFPNNLKLGANSEDVKKLQQFLNTHGFTVATSPQNGSPGHEITHFGFGTLNALKKFQKSIGLPATGYFGPMTRVYILIMY